MASSSTQRHWLKLKRIFHEQLQILSSPARQSLQQIGRQVESAWKIHCTALESGYLMNIFQIYFVQIASPGSNLNFNKIYYVNSQIQVNATAEKSWERERNTTPAFSPLQLTF